MPQNLNRSQRVLERLKSISEESVAGKYCINIQWDNLLISLLITRYRSIEASS
ncbi:hypothetical protein [Klebsiella phage vB_KpnS-VAC51]|uniref:Uncharacterized protein n=1 Tax=Klebsiella phage vB_KpnS-VAC51 TaxID=2866698 RepID=A0AAE8YEG9_9CAUD|nr:hypothetical protein [Klebsiella phage vB_KpnS-VAC51]